MRRLLLAAALFVPATAAAFTQAESEVGVPLHWLTPHATVHVDASAPSRQLSSEQVAGALNAALATWNAADPRVQLQQGASEAMPESAPIDCYLRFIQQSWSGPTNQLATTRPWVHADSGEIVAAVIEVNEADQHFATDGSEHFDLQAVLTHETGHLLGFGHTPVAIATMYPATALGELSQRMLAADDLDGLHTIYDSAVESSNRAGCSTLPGSVPSSSPALMMVLLTLVLARRAVRS